jgi:5-methylcytosine-specific restriction endonuclease McrA
MKNVQFRKPINPISKKKRKEIKDEKPIRQQLLERCKGLCEHCKQSPDWRGLHPHELIFRSKGGCLTLKNSEMWCGRCHAVEGHNLREAKDA